MTGLLRVDCFIYNASSLKEKRSVVKKIIDRIKNRFNVSIAETGHQELWQRTEISIAAVNSSQKIVESELTSALKYMESFPELEVANVYYEWY